MNAPLLVPAAFALACATGSVLAQSAHTILPGRTGGPFQGIWTADGKSGGDTVTIVQIDRQLCGVSQPAGQPKRIFYGRAAPGKAEVTVSEELDRSGRQGVAWSAAKTRIDIHGPALVSPLFNQGAPVALVADRIEIDAALEAACATKLAAIAPTPATQDLTCELDGIPVSYSDPLGTGRSGRRWCYQGGETLRSQEEIRDGKWGPIRRLYRQEDGLLEQTLNTETGRFDGPVRHYDYSGRLRGEATIERGEIKNVLEKTYFETRALRSIAFREHGTTIESVEFDRNGRLLAFQCTAGRNVLAEVRKPCGFEGEAETQISSTRYPRVLVSYVKGMKVKEDRYDGNRLAYSQTVRGGFAESRSFYPDGKLESKNKRKVNPAGEPVEPRTETITQYSRIGLPTGEVSWVNGVKSENWWYPTGEKQKEVRETWVRKGELLQITERTKTFDRSGAVLSDNSEQRLRKP